MTVDFSGLTDDDLESILDGWMFCGDERATLGVKIIRELLSLRQVVRQYEMDDYFIEEQDEIR